MASYNFQEANLKLVYETGVDESGKPIVTSKTYRNLRPNLQPDQLSTVSQAIANLCKHTLTDVNKVETHSVDM